MVSFPLCYYLLVFALVIYMKENIVLLSLQDFIILKRTVLDSS